MGSEKHKEMLFWTKEEYLKFAEAMMDKPQSYYAFEVLYWCGIREGELLALTPADFDLDVYKRQTQGRGQYVMEPSHYEPVPKNIADQIIAGRTKA